MASSFEDKVHPLEKAYFKLKELGLLRGNHLCDRVVVKFNGYQGNRSIMDNLELVTTLMKLGSFDKIHVEECRSTGDATVARDGDEWKLGRLAEALWDSASTQELCDALTQAGGPRVVAEEIMRMGRKR